MKKELIQLKILQVLIDALLILAAFALSYFLRIGFIFSSDFPFDHYAKIALAAMPITIFFAIFARAYKLSQRVFSFRHLQRVGFVAMMNVATFMILYYFTYRMFFSRLILVYIGGLTFLFMYAWHALFRWILQKCAEHEIGVYRALVIGANRSAEEIIRTLIQKKSHVKPVAIINAYGGGKPMIAGVPVVGKMNVFEKTIADHDIDLIIQADHLEQTVNILNYALSNNLRYTMPSNLLGVTQGEHLLEEVEGKLFFKIYHHKRWWDHLW